MLWSHVAREQNTALARPRSSRALLGWDQSRAGANQAGAVLAPPTALVSFGAFVSQKQRAGARARTAQLPVGTARCWTLEWSVRMCIINHSHKFIYVHAPRCAGTYVSVNLARYSEYRDQEVGSTALGEAAAPHYRSRFGLAKHSTAAELAQIVGPETYRDYLVVGSVRHPLSRARSIFRLLHRWRLWAEMDRYRQYAKGFFDQRDINEFVASAFFATPGPDRLFSPQVTWLMDAEHKHLLVNRTLRVQSIVQDLNALIADLGLSPIDPSEVTRKRNADSGSSLDLRLSSESTIILRERYADDFEKLSHGAEDDVA